MRLQGAALAAVLALVGGPALAAGGVGGDHSSTPVSTVTLAYELYMAGLTLGHVDVTARIQGGTYQAQSTLDTKGLVNAFWQAHIEASANGTLGAGWLKPALYDAFSRHGDKQQTVTVTYGPESPTGVAAEPPYSAKYPVSDEQRAHTVDPLSAMVFIATGVTANANNPCGTAAPIYDGRRRYDVQLIYRRTKDVSLDNGAYKGPALVCEIKYIQIAGFKQKILEEGKRLPPMFAWMVSMPSTVDTSRRYLIPIRLWAETDWGIAAAVVSKIHLDGASVAHAG